jgi:hypothetical protein
MLPRPADRINPAGNVIKNNFLTFELGSLFFGRALSTSRHIPSNNQTVFQIMKKQAGYEPDM